MNGPLRPWYGLEVAIRLASINWDTDVFQKVLKGEWVQFPVVTSCMAIQLTCQSKGLCVTNWMEMDEEQINDNAFQEHSKSIRALSFHNPHCISFGPFCNVDIHSVCSMIEALNSSGRHDEAMRLAVTLCGGLVLFYKALLFGFRDVTTLPVSARCHLGATSFPGRGKRGDNGNKVDPHPDGNGGSPMNVDTPNEKAHNDHVWPEDTILSITAFAFLFDLLLQKPDLADACLAEMKCKLASSVEASGLDALKSVHSLKFHIGVLGLFLQRLPAPSLHHEVWVSFLIVRLIIMCTSMIYAAYLHTMGPCYHEPSENQQPEPGSRYSE